MKRIETLILIGVASAAVFTGCRKENTMMAEPQYNTAQKNAPAEMPNVAQIGYTMKVMAPMPTNLLQWQAGYMTLGDLTFNANVAIEQDMTRPRYTMQVNRTIALLENGLSGTAVALGTMRIPSGTYTAQEFRVMLGNGTATVQNPPLMLSGGFVKNGHAVPVNIVINQAVQLPIGYDQTFIMPGMQAYYAAELVMNLNELTKGLNSALLNTAAITNSGITISENQNGNLYQMVRENLYNSLRIKIMNNTGTTNTTVPDPVK